METDPLKYHLHCENLFHSKDDTALLCNKHVMEREAALIQEPGIYKG